MIVPDDELCLQQMLGITTIPDDIEREYTIRIRMYHKQGAGGPLGSLALIDMLRFLGYTRDTASSAAPVDKVQWRLVKLGAAVQVRVDGHWLDDNAEFQGEIETGSLAIEINGRIEEYSALNVKLVQSTLPSDVDAESFEGNVDDLRDKPDARINLVEREYEDGDDVGGNPIFDNAPAVNWGNVKKGTPIWFRDGPDTFEGTFQRCLKDGKANILLDFEDSPREGVDRKDIVLAE